jgi:hypothetical protein
MSHRHAFVLPVSAGSCGLEAFADHFDQTHQSVIEAEAA